MKHEIDGDANCSWCTRYSHQRISKGTGGLGNKTMSGDYLNYSIIVIGQNTEKDPGDLRRRLTQKPVRNHRLTLLWKTLKRLTIIITHRILLDFEIQTKHPILAIRPDVDLSNTKWILPFQRRLRIKKSEKINKHLDLATKMQKNRT